MTSEIYTIASGKGGVGKTVTCINIAASLAELDKEVIIVDGNLAMGDMGLLLGLEDNPVTLNDVLANEANIEEAVYEKENFKVIPSSLELQKFGRADPENLNLTYLEENSDYTLIDTPPGLSGEVTSFIEKSEGLITATEPTLSSVLCSLKICNVSQNLGTQIKGSIITKITGADRELNAQRIEKVLGTQVLGRIPRDESINESSVYRQSLINYSPDSSASESYKRIAEGLTQS